MMNPKTNKKIHLLIAMRNFMNYMTVCLSALFLTLTFVFTSCEDDYLYDPSFIGDGDADVTAEITFPALRTALSRAVEGGTAGDAIRDINSVCILLYNADTGGFVRKYYFHGESPDMTISETTDRPGDYASGNGDERVDSEETTMRATVRLGIIPFGKYKIYAVANVPETTFTDDVVSDAENVKKIRLEWNNNVADNNQMFGYFSTDNSSLGFNAPTVTINRPSIRLQAWIRRVSSKVTVAFDGSGLNDGVEIFIQSVTIKDIPKYCLLGAQNPEEADKSIDLISDGESIIYNEVQDNESESAGFNENTIGYISKQHPINGCNQIVVNNASLSNTQKLNALHSETASALYMFENMQGKGESNSPSDKRQQVNSNHSGPSYPDGVDPSNIAWKDAKKYGSYIEVKAYYRALNSDGQLNEKEGKGEITYRFMLGKDAELDYNAERNYHYKLTMRFKGWANDIDWHIDYDKEPAYKLRFPRPFYISYLYGQPTMIPIEFEVKTGVTIKEIRTKITSNNWAPDEASNPFEISGMSFPTAIVSPQQYQKAVDMPQNTQAQINARNAEIARLQNLIKPTQPGSADYSKYYSYVKYMTKI